MTPEGRFVGIIYDHPLVRIYFPSDEEETLEEYGIEEVEEGYVSVVLELISPIIYEPNRLGYSYNATYRVSLKFEPSFVLWDISSSSLFPSSKRGEKMATLLINFANEVSRECREEILQLLRSSKVIHDPDDIKVSGETTHYETEKGIVHYIFRVWIRVYPVGGKSQVHFSDEFIGKLRDIKTILQDIVKKKFPYLIQRTQETVKEDVKCSGKIVEVSQLSGEFGLSGPDSNYFSSSDGILLLVPEQSAKVMVDFFKNNPPFRSVATYISLEFPRYTLYDYDDERIKKWYEGLIINNII
ncbi:MAG: hypothetical protein QW815_00310 [Nitrososphaerota archaeon]